VSELIALTRAVSPAMAACELTHLPRVTIDVAKAGAQHAEYERALTALGCSVVRLPAGPDMPDSVFIEDTAVVLDEIALIMRPGAGSRRAETADVEEWLKHRRLLGRIEAPGTMDGGDVLVAGRTVFVGASSRTNADGIDQMRRLVEYFGYSLQVVEVRGCLHLKSAVTALAGDALLINPRWAPADAFAGFDLVEVDANEPSAANIVRVGSSLLYSDGFPRTLARLATRGLAVTTVDVGEMAKAEGAVTCCSVMFESA
jgi:dimethylargininase